jgi:Cys-rich four helix bundle protein (predicted Tat secretion target)
MNRRQLIERAAPALVAAVPALWATASAAAAKVEPSGHAHHHPASSAKAAAMHEGCLPRRHTGLVAPFQACTAATSVCIAHCQVLLAQGDKGMAACLRTALDCDVTCSAVLKAATLNSDYTAALAKTALLAMEACVQACKPHIAHHAECRECHDACLSAMAAARQVV